MNVFYIFKICLSVQVLINIIFFNIYSDVRVSKRIRTLKKIKSNFISND